MALALGERLIARGRVLRPGKTLTVCRAEVAVLKEGKETACAAMQQTMMRIVGRDNVTG
jgi:acyl-coenzyme A thioesterase PaaI-like protein